MASPRVLNGLWWFPDEPNNRYPGDLTIGDLTELRLLGQDRKDFAFRKEHKPIEMMHGVSVEGTLVTLLDCLYAGSSFSVPGIVRTLWWPTKALIGDLIDSGDPAIDSAYFSFDHLEEWMSRRPFVVDPHNHKHVEYIGSPTAEWRVQSIHATVKATDAMQTEQSYTEFKMVHRSALGIHADEPQSIDWFADNAERLSVLLSLLISQPVVPRVMECRPDNRLIEVIFGRRVYPKKADPPSPAEIPLSMPVLESELERILGLWFDFDDHTQQAFKLYVDSLSKVESKPARFLSVIQTLEVFHRSEEPNDLSLRRRLSRLLSLMTPQEAELISTDNELLLDTAVHTRNYIVHYNERRPIFDGLDSHFALEALKTMATITLYRRLAINAELIIEAIEKTNNLQKRWSVPDKYRAQDS